MINEIVLPPDLIQSARSLEERFKLLHIPTRKVPLAEWNSLPPNIQSLVPYWIPTLLAHYSLSDAVLECSSNWKHQNWARYFLFFGPEQCKQEYSSKDYIYETDIFAKGFAPISYEADGDMWITSISEGPSAPIFLYDCSGGTTILASSRLALLMAAMGISEKSFDFNGNALKATSVMWHPER